MKKCCPSLRRVPLTVPLQRLFFQAVRTGVFSCRCADVRHRAVRKNTREAVLGLRVLLRHRVGRHDWHAGVQRITNADAPSWRQKKQTRRRTTKYKCWNAPSCGQKRHKLTRHEVLLVLHLRAVRKDTHETARRQVIWLPKQLCLSLGLNKLRAKRILRFKDFGVKAS